MAAVTIVEKDFSVYPLLHGPPRVGDTVAYKVEMINPESEEHFSSNLVHYRSR